MFPGAFLLFTGICCWHFFAIPGSAIGAKQSFDHYKTFSMRGLKVVRVSVLPGEFVRV